MPRYLSLPLAKNRKNDEIVYYSGLPVLFQFVRYHVGATGTGEHEIAGSVAAAGAGANPRADQIAVYDEQRAGRTCGTGVRGCRKRNRSGSVGQGVRFHRSDVGGQG